MHGEGAQTHGQQQLGEHRVTRHFTAHAHAFACGTRLHDARVNETEHSRVPGVVEMGHLLIGAVDGQRVLDQIVRADGDEIEIAKERGQGQGRCRHFDHGAHLDLAKRFAGFNQLTPSVINVFQGLANFAQVAQHRDHDLDRAMHGRTQERPQLPAEHAGFRQTPADGAQAQGRIEHRLLT